MGIGYRFWLAKVILKKRHLPKKLVSQLQNWEIGKDTAILAQFWTWVTTVATRKSTQMDLGKSKWKFPILKKRHLPKNWLPSFKIGKIGKDTVILAQFRSWVTTVGTRENAQIDLGKI